MPDVKLTDAVSATADIKLRDDAPLARSGLGDLKFPIIPLIGELDEPIDRCAFKSGAFGVKIASPGELAIQSTAGGALCLINRPQETLFDADEFAPRIPIAPGEAWIQIELDTSLDGKLAASANGFGVAVEGLTKVGLSTYTLLTASSGTLPPLRKAIETALERLLRHKGRSLHPVTTCGNSKCERTERNRQD